MLGKIESRRRRGQQRMRWLDGINGYEFEQTPGDSEGQGSLACCSPWMQRVGHDLVTEQQQSCDYYVYKHKYHYDSPLENTK